MLVKVVVFEFRKQGGKVRVDHLPVKPKPVLFLLGPNLMGQEIQIRPKARTKKDDIRWKLIPSVEHYRLGLHGADAAFLRLDQSALHQ